MCIDKCVVLCQDTSVSHHILIFIDHALAADVLDRAQAHSTEVKSQKDGPHASLPCRGKWPVPALAMPRPARDSNMILQCLVQISR